MVSSTLKRTAMTGLKRARKRGRYDRETIHAIVDAALLCHVGHLVDGQPVVTPTFHWREGEYLYWHGSRASRMLRAAMEAPVCVTVTHLDGLVVARSGFHHSANYRSAMIFGQAEIVDAPEEKLSACRRFVERLFPGRWAQLRAPSRQEMAATTVLRLPIVEASAKVRTGPPIDLEADLDSDVWAGVVPVQTRFGKPQPCPLLREGTPVPRHVRHFDFS